MEFAVWSLTFPAAGGDVVTGFVVSVGSFETDDPFVDSEPWFNVVIAVGLSVVAVVVVVFVVVVVVAIVVVVVVVVGIDPERKTEMTCTIVYILELLLYHQ